MKVVENLFKKACGEKLIYWKDMLYVHIGIAS